jgi:hypothetical protein
VASGTGFGRVRDHPNRKPTSRGLLPTPIGELLGESGKLDPKELEVALRLQRQTGDPLGSPLVQLGFVSERDVAASLGQALGLEASDAERLRAPAGCGHRLSVEFMKRYQVIPVGESDGTVDVAMADPTDTDTLQALELALGRRVRPLVALGADIQSAVQALWGGATGWGCRSRAWASWSPEARRPTTSVTCVTWRAKRRSSVQSTSSWRAHWRCAPRTFTGTNCYFYEGLLTRQCLRTRDARTTPTGIRTPGLRLAGPPLSVNRQWGAPYLRRRWS